MRQSDKGFTYEFNIVYIGPVIEKIFKMFNKYLFINVLIKKCSRTGWLLPSVLNMQLSSQGPC